MKIYFIIFNSFIVCVSPFFVCPHEIFLYCCVNAGPSGIEPHVTGVSGCVFLQKRISPSLQMCQRLEEDKQTATKSLKEV